MNNSALLKIAQKPYPSICVKREFGWDYLSRNSLWDIQSDGGLYVDLVIEKQIYSYNSKFYQSMPINNKI